MLHRFVLRSKLGTNNTRSPPHAAVDTSEEYAGIQCNVQDAPTQSTQIPGEAAGGKTFPGPTRRFRGRTGLAAARSTWSGVTASGAGAGATV